MARTDRPIIQALQRLLREKSPNGAMLETMRQFREGSDQKEYQDRAIILISTAYLEQAMQDAILTHCVTDVDKQKLFEGSSQGSGILGSGYALAIMCQALGIFGADAMKDLEKIRVIRNVCAHAKGHIDFSTPEIANACDFKIYAKLGDEQIVDNNESSAKLRFIDTLQFTILYLVLGEKEGRAKNFAASDLGVAFS